MRRANAASWRIGWDVPEELQFCGYVGELGGCSVTRDHDTPAQSQAGAEWRAWWGALPGRVASIEVGLPDSTNTSPFDRLRTMAARRQAIRQVIFFPPDFPELADAPALQERCRHYWLDFVPSWDIVGGVKWTLTHQLGEQIKRVNLNWVVKPTFRSGW